MHQFLLFVFYFIFSFYASAQTSPTFTFEGYLTGPGQVAVTGNQSFTISLYGNSTGTACLFYSEVHSAVSVQDGHFVIRVGSGTSKNFPATSGGVVVMEDFFKPGVKHNPNSSSPTCSFDPSVTTAQRLLGLSYYDTNTLTNINFALIEITSAPRTMVADTLQGLTPGQFVQYNSGSVALGHTPAYMPLARLDVNGSLKIADGGESCSVITDAGRIKYSGGSLQFCNGGSWQTVSTSAASGVTNINTSTGLIGGPITSTGTLSVDVGTGPGKILQLDGSGKIPAVDGSQITGLSASQLLTGTLSLARMPTLNSAQIWVGDSGNQAAPVALSGDATISNTGVLTLSNTAVTAGTYPKVTVDSKGRVTAGMNLLVSDITSLGFSAPAGTSGQVQFNNGSGLGASSNLFWDAGNNRLGIGTSSPTVLLDVSGVAKFSSMTTSSALSTFGNSTGYLSSGPTAQLAGALGVAVSNTNSVDNSFAPLKLSVRNSTSNLQSAYIAAVANASGNRPTIVFGQQTAVSAYSETMRIDSSGNVQIGTDSSSFGKLNVVGGPIYVDNNSNNNGGYITDAGLDGIGLTSAGVRLNSPDLYIEEDGDVGIGTMTPAYRLDVQGGDINASGSVRADGIALTSDVRYKRDIEPLDHALEKILSIRGVSYNWRVQEFPQKHFNDRHQVGVIAQEVEQQFPEVVETNKDGYKSVNYPALVAPVIEAVRALYHRITNTETVQANQAREISSKADKREMESLKTKIQELEQDHAKKTKELDMIKTYLCAKDPTAMICNH